MSFLKKVEVLALKKKHSKTVKSKPAKGKADSKPAKYWDGRTDISWRDFRNFVQENIKKINQSIKYKNAKEAKSVVSETIKLLTLFKEELAIMEKRQ